MSSISKLLTCLHAAASDYDDEDADYDDAEGPPAYGGKLQAKPDLNDYDDCCCVLK